MHGKSYDFGLRRSGNNLLSQLNAIDARQTNVDDCNIRFRLAQGFESVLAIGFAENNSHVILLLQQGTHSFSNECMVFDDHDSNHQILLFGQLWASSIKRSQAMLNRKFDEPRHAFNAKLVHYA